MTDNNTHAWGGDLSVPEDAPYNQLSDEQRCEVDAKLALGAHQPQLSGDGTTYVSPAEFRTELNRLYAAATAAAPDKYLDSYDLAAAARVNRHLLVNWIGGYAYPESSNERRRVLRAVADLLGEP